MINSLLTPVFRKCALLALLLVTWLPAYADIISIGVLNQRHGNQDMAFWTKTANYLSKQIPEHQFVIKSMGLECLTQAIDKDQLSFAITSPSHIVALEKTDDVRPIATLQTRYNQDVFSHFGAVLITRADRKDLKNLSDLKNQSVMAISPTEFGGYQIIWRELLLAGLSPKKDFFDMLFTNGAQQNIVKSILNEEADVGIIRSGLLEEMMAQGSLKPNQIKVLHPQDTKQYTPLHSSMIYANWSLIRLNHTEIALAREVSMTLQNMPKNESTLNYDAHYGWTKAESLTTVNGLLQALQLPPYEPFKQTSLKQILKEHGLVALLVLALILVLVFFTVRLGRMNRKLALSQAELAKHRDNLEQEVVDRTRELSEVNHALEEDIIAREAVEETLRRSRSALQGFYEISVNSLSHQQKLTELMKLARNHFNMEATFLYKLHAHDDLKTDLELQLCVSDGNTDAENLINQCIQASQFSENTDEVQFFESDQCHKCFLSLIVKVEGKAHCVLIFVGEAVRETEIAEVDKELLRLITQWIGSGIERQKIEEDREKYRSQLGKVTRLFTVGEMASGLAHEINQPLTAAVNYISGSLRRFKEGDMTNLQTGLERSLESLDRATNIIRRMREFVQTGVHRQEPFNLVQTIQRVLDLLEAEAKQNQVTLKSSGVDRPVWAIGDQVQIEQVILNLIRNGIEAIKSNDQAENHVLVSLEILENSVRIKVSDTGTGIDENDLLHIFDAFHTSKSDGMGLGLAICRSIIEAHNSSLKVENTALGAQFMFELPLTPLLIDSKESK